MARCSNCNGPLPPGSMVCTYCGNRTDIDLKGINYYTTHGNDQTRSCPRCDIALKTIDLKVNGQFLIERCDTCLGLFFDPGELEALLEAEVANVFAIDRSGLEVVNNERSPDHFGISYIKCPVCTKLMNRVNFGVKSGVIVDRCKEHGAWLDGGELRQLFEWMKLGGKLLEQERQEELRTEELKLDREKRDNSAGYGNYSGGASPFDSYGETLRMSDPDFFQIVVKAIRFFLR
jgi:Zn-finger nucleic acid-binding protein